MGVLSWARSLFARETAPGPVSDTRIVHTGRTDAGVYVDANTALKNDVVWACVQYLTRAVAQLPWHVMMETRKGSEIAKTHPADWILYKRPNPETGAFNFRQTMLGWALLQGNAYAEIQRDNRGAAYALWQIHPDRVLPRRNAYGELEYEVWNNGGNTIIAAQDMFHVKGFGDGIVGLSVVEHAAQQIGWSQATEIFGARYFGGGMNPSVIVTVPGKLSVEARDIMREDLDALYKGPKGRKTILLDDGTKFDKLSTNANDSQFVETMQHQVDVICRWFGVPPHKVMHLLRATFSNIEHQSIEVVVDSVTPWVKIFEEEADFKLFGPQNRQGLYTKMNLNGLLRGDSASRAALYTALFDKGLTINQILRREDMNEIGPDGDTVFVSNNVQTLERAIASPAPAVSEAAVEEPPAASEDGATDTPMLNFKGRRNGVTVN